MPPGLERSKLHVEGSDDLHTIVHLLIRHGIDYTPSPGRPRFPNRFQLAVWKSSLLE